MVLTKIVEAFISFGIWLFLKIVPKEPADRYERIKMTIPSESKARLIDFTSNTLFDAMSEATNWLIERDEQNYSNSFYVMAVYSEYDGEIGWTITMICSERIKR